MSTFATRRIACPACGARTRRTVAVTLNGGRRMDLRDELLAGTFQRVACPECRTRHRLDEPFVYVDFDRKQWITCFPPAREPEWRSLECEPLEDWKEAMLTHAPPLVRSWSVGFAVRAAFGLDALREKILCFEHGLNDVWLAILHLDVMRSVPGWGFHPSRRPRLVTVVGEDLVHQVGDEVWSVPRARVSAMQADPLAWAAAYEALGGGPYVDVGRLLMTGGAAA